MFCVSRRLWALTRAPFQPVPTGCFGSKRATTPCKPNFRFVSERVEFSSGPRGPLLATGGSAQMRGFATGVGSKADIGARPVVTALVGGRRGIPAGAEAATP